MHLWVKMGPMTCGTQVENPSGCCLSHILTGDIHLNSLKWKIPLGEKEKKKSSNKKTENNLQLSPNTRSRVLTKLGGLPRAMVFIGAHNIHPHSARNTSQAVPEVLHEARCFNPPISSTRHW